MNKPLNTATIREMDQQNFVHPWEGISSFGSANRTVAGRAEGIYVYDSDGNRLIDGPAGMWCVQIGHGRKDMADAVAAQTMEMTYNSPWGLTNGPAAKLARKIAERAPGDLNNVFFTTGGSTAVDSSLRFVAFYNNVLGRPEKKLIISRDGAYHGSTYLSASCSGKERDKNWFDFADDLVHFLPSPNPFLRPSHTDVATFCDQKVSEIENRILELGSERVAAFIAEPILASGGVIIPPPGYHKRCLEVCRKHDVIYISDEVVTAFGRLGHWFASEDVFGIQPDIITSAKGLTSGYLPLGAMILSDRLLDDIKQSGKENVTFSNGYTYSGHPVACAAALKNIEIIETERILEHVRDIAPYFQQSLQSLSDIPIVADVRGEGLMACVECRISNDKELALDAEIGSRIDKHCQKLGLLVRPLINMNVLSPPLIITRDQIDEMTGLLRRGIENAMEDVIAEGVWAS